jgi:hypothetical protein
LAEVSSSEEEAEPPFGTDTFTVTVANVLPALTVPSEPQLADEGTVKPFSLGSFTDPGLDGPWTVTVDWGDGETSDPI